MIEQSQQKMFPLDPIEIIQTYPSGANTAHLRLIGEGRDGKDYAIKTLQDGKGFIPASEFFCYELAKLVDIPTPEYAILKMFDELAFGSVWRGDAETITSELNNFILNEAPDDKLLKVMSKIYGFDLFVNNIDRHFSNYLFCSSYQNRRVVFAFDFSQAWLEVDFSGLQVLNKNCGTYKVSELLKTKKLLNLDLGVTTIEKLSKIPADRIELILKKLVEVNWIDDFQMGLVLSWWGKQEFYDRVDQLKNEVMR